MNNVRSCHVTFSVIYGPLKSFAMLITRSVKINPWSAEKPDLKWCGRVGALAQISLQLEAFQMQQAVEGSRCVTSNTHCKLLTNAF